MSKRQTIGQRIAKKFDDAKDKQRARFGDIIGRGGNPHEYGMLSDDELLAQVIDEDKQLAKIIDKAARYEGLCD